MSENKNAKTPADGPVAWMHTTAAGLVYFRKKPQDKVFSPQAVYTAPAKREWVGLREDEIFSILENLQTIYNRPPTEDSRIIFAKAVEQALKEKNGG